MQFVLKVFHKIREPSRRNAFLAEIEHLGSLNHLAITRIFDEGIFNADTGMQYPSQSSSLFLSPLAASYEELRTLIGKRSQFGKFLLWGKIGPYIWVANQQAVG